MQQSVVVQHQEGDSWALVLTATRSEYGKAQYYADDFCE